MYAYSVYSKCMYIVVHMIRIVVQHDKCMIRIVVQHDKCMISVPFKVRLGLKPPSTRESCVNKVYISILVGASQTKK